MTTDAAFRLASATLLVGTVATSGFYRARADRLGGRLPDSPDGHVAVPLRIAIGILILAILVVPIVAPTAASWMFVSLPFGVRALGLALTALAWPFLWWTLASIGSNISPTTSTRADASLVTHGAYRVVRHPIYSGGFVAFLGLGLSLQSIPMLVGLAGLIAWLPGRARREEANLTAFHGDAYRRYSDRTGRFFPRWPRDP